MNLEDYKEKRKLYKQFAKIVKNILATAIDHSKVNNGYQYHLQQIQYRAKTHESLTQRLTENNLHNTDNIEEIRSDLAGCRIIFYYNDDVNAFLNSGLIRENFKVHWDETKIHGSQGKSSTANDYYTASHYVVELNDARASLPEYARFKRLKCEIQIQTVLNHAWAETAHDLTYKKPIKSAFESQILKAIDERLQNIMEKYLKPASHEFQKIQHDRRRLLEGKKLLDRDLQQEIVDCQNNNERHDILERYREYTLPLYDEEFIRSEINTILNIVQTAFSISQIDINTPFGHIQGKTSQDILSICLKILSFIRYINVESTFSCLISFYRSCKNDNERNAIRESIKSLAKYDINVLRQAGLLVQNILLDYLNGLDANVLSEIIEVIVDVCNCILDPSTESIESNYKSFTISQGSIPGNKNSEILRSRALTLLTNNYNVNHTETLKQQFISAFNAATRTPIQNGYSDDLLAIILDNSNQIIEFYTSIIPYDSYEMLNSIESDICFLYKRALDIKNSGRITNQQCLNNCDLILKNAITFKDILNANDDFVTYKTLVGYESVFEDSWTNDTYDFQAKFSYREDKIKEYVNDFDKKGENYWKNIILRCTQTTSNDLATFPIFGEFLNILSTQKPSFMLNLIKTQPQSLMPFSSPILTGLLSSDKHSDTIATMNEWADQEKYLYECAKSFEFYSPVDENLLDKILKKSEKHNASALSKIVTVAARNFNNDNIHLIPRFFLPALKMLTNLKNALWILDNFWFKKEEPKKAIQSLNSNEIDLLFKNLIFLSKIDYHVEEILIPIAEKFPDKLLSFFRNRFVFKNSVDNSDKYYEAIPFNFHNLNKYLALNLDLMVDSICSWYNNEYYMFSLNEGKLIHNIFPDFPAQLEEKLLKIAQTHDEKNIFVAMAILRNYHDKPSLYSICKEIIIRIEDDSKLLNEIHIILENTGVIEGEYGRKNILIQKRAAIANWINDPNRKVKEFAKNHTQQLDNQIKYEQQRVEEEIELRKHIYGDSKTSE